MARRLLHLCMPNSLNKIKMKIIIGKLGDVSTYNGKTINQILEMLPTKKVEAKHVEFVVVSFSNHLDWGTIIKNLEEEGFEPVLIIALIKNLFNIGLGEARDIYDQRNVKE